MTRFPGSDSAAPPAGGGFTIMELMVALALALIIFLCISRVSSEAQQIFDETTTRVELYQKFRYAMGDLKSQLERWQVTSDLEFFIDAQGSPNGHWNGGEQIPDKNNLDGGRPEKYDEAAQIVERTYQWIPEVGAPQDHDSFSIYFKALTEIEGVLRIANIEYFLADASTGDWRRVGAEVEGEALRDLSLVKVVRWIDEQSEEEVKRGQKPGDKRRGADLTKSVRKVRKKTIELCQNVTDLRFEYYCDNEHDSQPGAFLTPGEEKLGKILKSEHPVTALPNGGLLKEFMYGGTDRVTHGNAERGERKSDTGAVRWVEFSAGAATAGINFSELAFGDTIYIWKEQGQLGAFKAGDYTLFRKVTGKLEFQETIDSSLWDGDQSGLRFKAGYVPSALRITLRVLDDKGRNPRYLQSIVYPFQKRA